jgi:hypothetical protein
MPILPLPGAVLFAEAITLFREIGDPNYGTEPLWAAIIETRWLHRRCVHPYQAS